MRDSRKPFLALDADIDDSRLERLAEEKGVATMVKPADLPGEGARSVRKAEPRIDPETIPTPRAHMKNFSIEIPDYVWKELKLRAFHRGTTIKHVIMTSLKAEGFEIRNADMIEDGRRDRGGNE